MILNLFCSNVYGNFRNFLPIFFAVSSMLLTLTFGILQLTGAHPFTEKNVTIGWVYISISLTVASFLGMYIGFGLIYLIEMVFGEYTPPNSILELREREQDILKELRELRERNSNNKDYIVNMETVN